MIRVNSCSPLDSRLMALNSKSWKIEIVKDRLFVAIVLCNKSSNWYGRMKKILIIPNIIISSTGAFINNQNIDTMNHEKL